MQVTLKVLTRKYSLIHISSELENEGLLTFLIDHMKEKKIEASILRTDTEWNIKINKYILNI